MRTAGLRRGKGPLVWFICWISLLATGSPLSGLAGSPPNDQFAGRINLSGTDPQATGSTINATVQAGEPAHGDFPGGVSVWWSWTAPTSGDCSITTEGSSFYTLLAVYSGNSISNLARIATASLFSGANGTSKTSFYAIRGVTYAIAVDGYYGATGQVQLILHQDSPALVNSWIKFTSGNWEENYWSLSMQPSSSQSLVCLTNTGYKALTIGAQTVSQAPSSLVLSNLCLSAPASSFNTLLLNYSGPGNPLRVRENMVVQTNCKVALFSAGLRVGEGTSGGLYLGGTINHSDNSDAFFQTAQIGYGQSGEYDLTNGTVTAGELIIGGGAPGIWNQLGGSNRVLGFLAIRNAGGFYNLKSGSVNVGSLQVGQGSGAGGARLQQGSGSLVASNWLAVGDVSYLNGGAGIFELQGGTVSTPVLSGLRGSFVQTGGTNSTTTSQFGGSDPFVYNLTGGTWFSSDDYLGYHGATVVNQTGGNHVVTNSLYIFAYGGYEGQGAYNLTNGSLKASALYLGAKGTLNQAGGTIALNSTLGVGNGGTVRLTGGTITVPRTSLGDSALQDYPIFTHSGGTHNISSELTLNAGTYILKGGLLIASNITLLSGTLTNNGGSISNRGRFTFSGGAFYPGSQNQQLGKIVVDGHAKLDFSGGASVVRFLASSDANWYDYGLLSIEHWIGLVKGGGANQMLCGTAQNGLSVQQLSKIVFRDPAGLPAGTYLARMLPTGEIVPAAPPTLSHARMGSDWVFTWPAGFTLQTATNVTGPYEEVVGATSPFTNAVAAGPMRFYRIYKF
ncbi:MAG: hypothetical protein JWM16_4750 [Verrucomicrobiales bacterium]|nr:hypothetical protein [Verrucomicrobiales bacterium]